MKPAIEIRNLSKKYRRGGHAPYLTLRDSLTDIFKRRQPELTRNEFWALKDINLEIAPGEVVGIIGRNGAGKSTLLKVLSRITHPTSGEVILRGRVGSLLEVGTGFHQELTGRENIFLNGAILGMNRIEIRQKFDEIVNFAEVEKFIDTPVKHYSSGMFVRLAFAVAAHLQTDILLVDEVLAVGDAIFQKKCLNKMNEVARAEGRTILLVSHNREAIRSLCASAILIDNGRVGSSGTTDQVMRVYDKQIRSLEINSRTSISNEAYRRGNGALRISKLKISKPGGKAGYTYQIGELIQIRIDFQVSQKIHGLSFFLGLRSGHSRELVTSTSHTITEKSLPPRTKGFLELELDTQDLLPGEYPLYWHLSEIGQATRNVDVIDDLTPPLVLKQPNSKSQIGYFRMPSRLVSQEISHG